MLKNNKQKLVQVAIVLVLVLFSFYYTNKTIDIIRSTDPLMKQIKEQSKKYQIPAENAKMEGNKITPGKNGKEVDYEQSYEKMKRYGTYNESLTVFKETTPAISIEDTYDKYVIGGNDSKKEVALVFPIDNTKDPTEIIKITGTYNKYDETNNSNYSKYRKIW